MVFDNPRYFRFCSAKSIFQFSGLYSKKQIRRRRRFLRSRSGFWSLCAIGNDLHFIIHENRQFFLTFLSESDNARRTDREKYFCDLKGYAPTHPQQKDPSISGEGKRRASENCRFFTADGLAGWR
jgi:hypothetical protein